MTNKPMKNCEPNNPNNEYQYNIMPEASKTKNLYVFQLPEVIDRAEDFKPLFALLRTAGPEDVIRLDINCRGGRLDITTQLLEYMSNTQATINGHLYEAWSAATLILLKCDNIMINDNSIMMIHTGSYSTGYNKVNNNTEQAVFWDKYTADLFRREYKHFLTEEEIESMLAGTDYYMTSDQILKRLKTKIAKCKQDRKKSKPTE